MNASVRYYADKYIEISAEINKLRTELDEVLDAHRELEQITGKPKRKFLGKKTLEAQISKYENQLTDIKTNLRKKAKAIIDWHDRAEYLERSIKQISEDIIGRESKISNLTTVIQTGFKLKDSEIDMYLNFGYLQKKDEQRLKSLIKEQEKHTRQKIKESRKYGIELLEAVQADDFKAAKDYMTTTNIMKSLGLNTDLPDLHNILASSAARAEENAGTTVSDVSALSEDTEISDFDKEMLAAQNAPRVVHKI